MRLNKQHSLELLEGAVLVHLVGAVFDVHLEVVVGVLANDVSDVGDLH